MSRSLSEDLNNPALFTVNKPGDYSYENGKLGKSACGQLTLAPTNRDSAAQKAAGGEQRRGVDNPYGIDDGGHLIGARFRGASADENLTAQDRNLNRQDYKHLENKWAALLSDKSNKVFVNVEAYARDGGGRPTCYQGYYIVEHTDETGSVRRSFETFSFLNESRQQIDSFQTPDPDAGRGSGITSTGMPPKAASRGGNEHHAKAATKEDARMAERMNPTHYSNMIQALRLFARNSLATSKELIAASNACTTVLGDDDIASGRISAETIGSASKLSELANEAVRIAQSMQEELENAQSRTNSAWSSDE